MKILCLPDLRLRKPYTVLPQPNAIDQWLSGNNINSSGSLGDIQSDHVSCMVQLVITPKYRENFYRYNLSLYVEVPELSGIDIAHLSSPIVTLGRYEGHHLDADAPEWTRIASSTTFEIRQPSGSMADVFTEIAFWPENADIPRLCKLMLTWADIISFIPPSDRKPTPSLMVDSAATEAHPAELKCRRSTRVRRQTIRFSNAIP